MSADLWAAFGNGEEATSNPWSQPSPTDQKQSSASLGTTSTKASSDILVNLHAPQTAEYQYSQSQQSPWGAESTYGSAHEVAKSPATRDLSSSRFEEEEEISWTDFSAPKELVDPWTAPRTLPGTEVLWDADQATDNDDFGDFEDGTADISSKMSNLGVATGSYKSSSLRSSTGTRYVSNPAPQAESIVSRGRSSGQKSTNSSLEPHPPSEMSVTSANVDSNMVVSKSKTLKQASIIDKQNSDTEEDWDEWSPDPLKNNQFSSQTALKPTKTSPVAQSILQSSAPISKSAPREASRSRSQQRLPPSSTLPPTNVPPPSILISLLCTLISTLPAQVEKAMTAFTEKSESSAAADRALSTAVRKCLAALRVAGRIVAGRKLRWKRDTLLSQSMRIGPAAAGGKGGMKLSGLDRNEIQREDREVAEFVRIWQGKLGSVRRALANVNSRIGEASVGDGNSGNTGKKLELPSIAETMVIRTLKGDADGGVRSAKACTLCGIKREERVDKVDGGEVFDVASEWWMEHWGHVECRAFWYQHEKYLQQR